VILILMTSRSGSSLVAKIFAAHGFNTGGERVFSCGYETFENAAVNRWIKRHKSQLPLQTGEPCAYVPGIESCIPENAVVKIALEYSGLFEKLNPKVITVKRDVTQIARSVADKRGDPSQADGIVPAMQVRMAGLDSAREKWNGAEINTDEIIAGDFSKVEAAFKHHGLHYDEVKAWACVDRDKWHTWSSR
jgi:hypothetical protein